MSITLQSIDHARNLLMIDYGINPNDVDAVFYCICNDPKVGLLPDINDLEIWEVVLAVANDTLDRVKDDNVITPEIPVIKKDLPNLSKISRQNSLIEVEKRQVKPEDKKDLSERWKKGKSRSANKFNKNKNIENASVADISYTKYQETIATTGYLYNLDRKYAIKFTENLAILLIDKKQGSQYQIGDLISLHPSYGIIPRSEYFDLSLVIQCELQQFFSDLRSNHNPKMVDLKYWLQFKDCNQAKVIIANVSDKLRIEKFNQWYANQSYQSLKNWIKRQSKKGIITQNWYIKLDNGEKIIDKKRIEEIWQECNI